MKFSTKGHTVQDRYLGPGYNALLLRLFPGDLLVRTHIDSSTYFQAFYIVRLHYLTLINPNACLPSRGVIPRKWGHESQKLNL